MKRLLPLLVVLCAVCAPGLAAPAHAADAHAADTHAASADSVRFYQDPVWEPENAEEPHPMQDLMDLATGGDVRAQFILADLYSKGKGGFVRSTAKARQWFETSARAGYTPSFIRLAAIARHRDDAVEAYKWYSLAAEAHDADGDYAQKAREDWAQEKNLTRDDLKEADKRVDAWKKDLAARNRAAAEEEKLARRRADAKARADREQADINTRAQEQADRERARADAVQARADQQRAAHDARAKDKADAALKKDKPAKAKTADAKPAAAAAPAPAGLNN